MSMSTEIPVTPQASLMSRFHDIFGRVEAGAVGLLDEMKPLYAERLVFQDPMQKVESRDEFLEVNRRLFERARKLRFELGAPVGTDEAFFIPWTMHFAAKVGPEFVVDGVTQILAQRGRIVLHRDHWDLANLLASAVPGGPMILRGILKPFT